MKHKNYMRRLLFLVVLAMLVLMPGIAQAQSVTKYVSTFTGYNADNGSCTSANDNNYTGTAVTWDDAGYINIEPGEAALSSLTTGFTLSGNLVQSIKLIGETKNIELGVTLIDSDGSSKEVTNDDYRPSLYDENINTSDDGWDIHMLLDDDSKTISGIKFSFYKRSDLEDGEEAYIHLKSIVVTMATEYRSEGQSYNLWLGETRVTDDNREDLREAAGLSSTDNTTYYASTVRFDPSTNTLYLDKVLGANNYGEYGGMYNPIISQLPRLTIHATGGSIIKANNPIQFTGETNGGTLTIEGSDTLYIRNTGAGSIITGFDDVTITPVLRSPAAVTYDTTNKKLVDGSGNDVTELKLGELMPLTQDEGEKSVDFTAMDGKNVTELQNAIIDGKMLVTLNNTNGDAYNSTNNYIELGTTMKGEDINSIISNYTPGTNAFAEAFHGITTKVAAGTGTISVDAETGADGVLNVKIGTAEPIVITGLTSHEATEIPYLCFKDTYVYIYNASDVVDPSAAPKRAQGLGDPRLIGGRKTTTTPRVHGVSIAVTKVSNDPDNTEGVALDPAEVIYDSHSQSIEIDDNTITSLPNDVFKDAVTGQKVAYIDLSKTSVTGVDVSRSSGAFNGVDPRTIIILPAGNTSTEANVVSGTVGTQLKIYNDAYGFYIPWSVVVPSVENQRELAISADAYTTCLPYSLKSTDDIKFYEFTGVTGTTVNFSEVAETEACKPYLMIKSGAGGTLSTTELTTLDSWGASYTYISYDAIFRGNYEKEIDDYSEDSYLTDGNYYILQSGNRWGRIPATPGSEVKIAPFRAYLYYAQPSPVPMLSSSLDGNGATTGIEQIRTIDRQGREQYFDLQGRRIATPKKGIFIRDGKKVIVK